MRLIGGFGFIFPGYAPCDAIQCLQIGSKYGIPSLVDAGLALAVVPIGWVLKLTLNPA